MIKNSAMIKLSVIALLLAVLIVGVSYFDPTPARAITVSPIRLELDANPGQVVTGLIKVHNDQRIKKKFFLSVGAFESLDESGEPKFIPGVTKGLVSWMAVPDSIEVESLGYRDVPYTISVPSTAQPGGYFAAIFVSSIPQASTDPGTVAIQNDVGTLVLFRVNGEFAQGESVIEFDTKDKKHWFVALPVEFYFRFQNNGDDRAKPLGDITIRNWFRGLTKQITANRGAGNTLPKTIRRYDSAWVTAGGDSIERNVEVVYPKFKNFRDAVRYEWDNFALGRYTADLQTTVNNDASRSYSKSLSFWVVPWHLLAVIVGVSLVFLIPLIILILLIIFLVWRRRRTRP